MSRFKNTRLWLYGLLSSVISASAGATTVIAVDPKTFNFDEGLRPLLEVAAVLAFVAMGNYLQKHPLPKWDDADPPIEDVARRMLDRVANDRKEDV